QERTGLERHHQDSRAGECANGDQVLCRSGHKNARRAESASRTAVNERAARRGKAPLAIKFRWTKRRTPIDSARIPQLILRLVLRETWAARLHAPPNQARKIGLTASG